MFTYSTCPFSPLDKLYQLDVSKNGWSGKMKGLENSWLSLMRVDSWWGSLSLWDTSSEETVHDVLDEKDPPFCFLQCPITHSYPLFSPLESNSHLYSASYSFSSPLRDHLRGNKLVFMRSDLYPSLLWDWHMSLKDEGMSAEYFRGEERESDIPELEEGRLGWACELTWSHSL